MADADILIEFETPQDRDAVDRLVDNAFGFGRFAKTAERLREGNRPIDGLSLVARLGGQVVGAVRLWPVRIGGAPAAFLGPIAVEAALRERGLGARLVERACALADEAGHAAVLLVGDEPYFGPFGFHKAEVTLPGPVDPARVLIRGERPSGPATRA